MNVQLVVISVGAWIVIDIISRIRIAAIKNVTRRERYIDYFMVANIAALLVLFIYLYKTYMDTTGAAG